MAVIESLFSDLVRTGIGSPAVPDATHPFGEGGRRMRFRHSAGFGKRIEFWIIGMMLKEGLDVYVPLVDDNAIDAVVRRRDRSFVEVQIKARSRDVNPGDAALFSAIPHELRNNYWFVFYSERLSTMWIMNSEEFLAESYQNKTGKNAGLRSIWFNGKRKDKATGAYVEHVYPRFQRYVAANFSRIAGGIVESTPATVRPAEGSLLVT
jgi:hypothetical protein